MLGKDLIIMPQKRQEDKRLKKKDRQKFFTSSPTRNQQIQISKF